MTVEEIKNREARMEERKAEKKLQRIKRIARRILRLRAHGVKSFRADSTLGKQVHKYDGFWCNGEDTLYWVLKQLGIELSNEEEDESNIIRIII